MQNRTQYRLDTINAERMPVVPSALKITKKKAFTLIELLIVMAIISLLAAILFPVFGRVRENARRASCQSNLRQISLGLMQYSQDYDELNGLYFMRTSVDNIAWNQTLQPYVKSTQVFQCPSDVNANSTATAYWVTPGDPAYPKPFHSSYIINSAVNSLNLAALQNPSQTVMMTDGGVVASTTAPYTTQTPKPLSWILSVPEYGPMSSSSNEDWAAPNARHLGTSVVAFADGHVKAMHTEQWYYTATPWLNPAIGGS